MIWAEFHSVAGGYPILKNHLLGIIVLFTTCGGFKLKNQQNTDVWIIVLAYVGLDNKTMLSSLHDPVVRSCDA